MDERARHHDLNPLEHPICLETPRRLTGFSAWSGHIPFAMLLVDLLRPRVIVELGTYYGDSFFAFCQAAQQVGLDCTCFAIDSWEGDPHVVYSNGSEVFADVRAHRDAYYGSFAQLIRRGFDEGLSRFADGTIDLLHIDGNHCYEAVKHDFNAWLPKMSPGSVVLLHDTCVRERDFGVWKLWEEIESRLAGFEFLHCHGLGVLLTGSECASALAGLFDATPEEVWRIRRLFAALGERLELGIDLVRRQQEHNAQTHVSLRIYLRRLMSALRNRVARLLPLA